MQRRRLRAGRRRVPESGASSDYDSVWVSDVVPPVRRRRTDVSRTRVASQSAETKRKEYSLVEIDKIKRGVKTDAQTPKLKLSHISGEHN